MAKVGRPKAAIPTIDWKLHLPVTLAAEIDTLLLDPVTHKVVYGARSALITHLLQSWLDQFRAKSKEEKQPTTGLANLAIPHDNSQSTTQEP